MFAPVVLFVYSRLKHTDFVIRSLLNNIESSETDLIIFSDAAKTPDQLLSVNQVRDYILSITGFRSVKIYMRSSNYGLSKSIIDGVTQVLVDYESVIVLEDDIVVSPFFLKYMNEGLEIFRNVHRVISIHGYTYPCGGKLPNAFFMRGADCWGWATWRRGWKLFNPDGNLLLNQLKQMKLVKSFDFNGAYRYSKMLESQINGKNDSWAIRWHASAFLANKLTLYPGQSLVQNIGNDSSGTHCSTDAVWDVSVSQKPIDLDGLKVEECEPCKKLIEFFFRKRQLLVKVRLGRIFERLNGVNCRKIVFYFLPPIIALFLRRLVSKYLTRGVTFEGPYESWDDLTRDSSGYSNQIILDKVLQATLKVKHGFAKYERDSVVFDQISYSWPLATALMWAAANSSGKLSVLDFGGSLGTSFYQNKIFINQLKSVRWSIVEQKNFVEAGRDNIQDEQLIFYESIQECMKNEVPNIIVLSSVLQYLKDPVATLRELVSLSIDIVIIDLAIVQNHSSKKLYLQKVQDNIYSASYPVWSLLEKEIIEVFTKENYQLISDFKTLKFPQLELIKSDFKGFIFSRKIDAKPN